MILPTTIPGGIEFFAACAFAALVVIFFARLLYSPYHFLKEARKKLEILQPIETGPNWSIKELFLHLAPEALDHTKEELWSKAGDQIRDALSLGKLRIWGRPFETKLGKWVGERAALRLIDPTYWQKAYFTYVFFYAQTEDAHCFADRNTGRPSYTDLQVNRAEALALWPGEPKDIATLYPNIRVADNPELIDLFINPGIEHNKLAALLQEDKIRSWAKRGSVANSELHKLNGSVWENKKLTFMPIESPGAINQTFLKEKSHRPWATPSFSHYDVWLNYTELKNIWPSLKIQITTKDVG